MELTTEHNTYLPNFNDTHLGGVLAQKIVISVQRGKNTQTKIEGIPSQYSLNKLLKKLKAKDMLSCGGHIAKDKETGCEFIVLQGRFTMEVAAFLTSEGIVDADCILFRGE
jgi:translation initiation factor 1 (eIF-1/SUI1)